MANSDNYLKFAEDMDDITKRATSSIKKSRFQLNGFLGSDLIDDILYALNGGTKCAYDMVELLDLIDETREVLSNTDKFTI